MHNRKPTLKLMSEGKINADKMINEVGIDEWEKAYTLIKSGEATKIVMHPIG